MKIPPPLPAFASAHRELDRELNRMADALEVCAAGVVERFDAAAGGMGLAMRRFDQIERLHGEDEERSLHPRLREAVPDRLGWLAMLASEHARVEAGWVVLRPRLETLRQQLEAGGNPDPAEAAELARDFGRLAAALRAHMALEDRELLPLAAAALDASMLAAIAREMRERRG